MSVLCRLPQRGSVIAGDGKDRIMGRWHWGPKKRMNLVASIRTACDFLQSTEVYGRSE